LHPERLALTVLPFRKRAHASSHTHIHFATTILKKRPEKEEKDNLWHYATRIFTATHQLLGILR
jgi:hypothetical protein